MAIDAGKPSSSALQIRERISVHVGPTNLLRLAQSWCPGLVTPYHETLVYNDGDGGFNCDRIRPELRAARDDDMIAPLTELDVEENEQPVGPFLAHETREEVHVNRLSLGPGVGRAEPEGFDELEKMELYDYSLLQHAEAWLVVDEDIVIRSGETGYAKTAIRMKTRRHIGRKQTLRCVQSPMMCDLGSTLDRLYTLDSLDANNYMITNYTAHDIVLPYNAKLATVVYADVQEPKYRVKDREAFDKFCAKKCKDKRCDHKQEDDAPRLNVLTDQPPKELPLDKKQEARRLLNQVRHSKYGVLLDESTPRLEERVLLLAEATKLSPNSMLTREQADELASLLLAYADRACLDMADLPRSKLDPMPIDTGDARPIRTRMRPCPVNARDFLKTEIDEMKRAGIIEEIFDAEWCFPIVIALKDGGTKFRCCVDFRALNKVTHVPQQPMPMAEDLVRRVKDKPFMAQLDMASAFWTVPLKEEDRDKATFICEEGTFRFNTCPFGLAGAPAHYQSQLRKVTETIINATRDGKCKNFAPEHFVLMNYIDDVLLATDTFEHYIELMKATLETFRTFDLKYSPKKTNFALKEIKYLGYIITSDTWRPDPDRIKALRDRPPPGTLKELRGLIATIAFYQRFLPSVAGALEPLLEKLRGIEKKHAKKQTKALKINLEPRALEAWDKVRQLLCGDLLLWHIQLGRVFHLATDACDTASGSILCQGTVCQPLPQLGRENDVRPVAFHSRVFNKAERNYPASEREMLAVIHALEKYQYLLMGPGATIFVYTDHRALVMLVISKRGTSVRLERWRLRLDKYNLQWRYIPGESTGAADFLSRPPEECWARFAEITRSAIDINPEDEEGPHYPMLMTIQAETQFDADGVEVRNEEFTASEYDTYIELRDRAICEEQEKDEECLELVKYLEDEENKKYSLEDFRRKFKNPEKRLRQYARRCQIIKGVLVVYSDLRAPLLVPVVPRVMRANILEVAHASDSGHLRGQRTFQIIAVRCSWPTLRGDVRDYLQKCDACTKYFAALKFQPPPGRFEASRPFEQVTIDAAKIGKHGEDQEWALVAVDTFSHFMVAVILPDQTAEAQIKALEDSLLSVAGEVDTIVCDAHPAYTSDLFREWAKRRRITLSISGGYSPKHCAMVNVAHKTIRAMINRCSGAGLTWRQLLSPVVQMYNNSPLPQLGFTPREVLFGELPRSKLEKEMKIEFKPTAADKDDVMAGMAIKRHIIQQAIKEMNEKNGAHAKRAYLDNRSPRKVAMGSESDLVYRTVPNEDVKHGKSYATRYFGPYVIERVESDGVHCYIKPLNNPHIRQIRVKMSELAPPKDRSIVPEYPSSDLVNQENADRREANVKKRSAVLTKDYFQQAPHHHNTRSKDRFLDD